MTLRKIEKQDFVKFRHELVLAISYSLILALVYGSWTMISLKKWWAAILVGAGFVIVGAVFYYFWINHLKCKEQKEKL